MAARRAEVKLSNTLTFNRPNKLIKHVRYRAARYLTFTFAGLGLLKASWEQGPSSLHQFDYRTKTLVDDQKGKHIPAKSLMTSDQNKHDLSALPMNIRRYT